MNGKIMAAAACLAVLAGCANPSIVNINQKAMDSLHVAKVYVPRFEGSPEFVEESTDLFVSELQGRTHADVTQGDALRYEHPDVLAGGNLATTDTAIAEAKKRGAQVVIMGKVTSYDAHGTLNGFATVRVVDVATGRIIASVHRPSGLLVGNVHQAVLAAVKRTADDVADALE
jgi:curli biogenesis system outer membrane secretion channel CsgG